MESKEEGSTRKVDRRRFLKTAAATAGITGAAALVGSSPVKAAGPSVMKLAVRQLDSPPYETNSELQRMDAQYNAFNHPDVPAYLKSEGVSSAASAEEKIRNDVPGFTLKDYALYDVGKTSNILLGFRMNANGSPPWEPRGIANIARTQRIGRWEGTPEEGSRIIKKAAKLFGSGMTGVAALNEMWFYTTDCHKPVIFTDDVDEPTVTDDAKYIPRTMDRVVACIIPIQREYMQFMPGALGEGAVTVAYSQMAITATTLAEYIRELGYHAIPMGNDTSLSVPIAIDAGLGEAGRNGLLVNPIFGPACRPAKVLTDMPLAVDKPIEFGVREFCKACMKCARDCPGQCISTDVEPSFETRCPSNNPGVKKWYVDTWKCYRTWNELGTGCGVCMQVCPFSKPQDNWMHSLVKGVAATTPIFDSLFVKMDDAFGYGKFLDDVDPEEWWKS